MADSQNFQGQLLSALADFLEPLVELAGDDNAVSRLLTALGWELEAFQGFPTTLVNDTLTALQQAVADIETVVLAPPQSLGDWVTAAKATATAVTDIINLSSKVTAAGITGDLENLGQDLVNLLAVQYLRESRPVLYRLFILLGIITQESIDTATDASGQIQRNAIVLDRLNLGAVSGLLKDPGGTLNAEYNTANGLPDPNGTADLLFPRVVALLQEFNVDASYGVDSSSAPLLGTDGFTLAAHTMVIFKPIPTSTSADGGFGVALNLDSQLGLAVKPFGVLSISEALRNWTLSLDAEVAAGGFALRRSGVTFPSGLSGDSITIQATLIKMPSPDQVGDGTGAAFLIGSASGTRLQLQGFFTQGQATLSTSSQKFGITFAAQGGSLVISAGDGDGFLSSVLPGETTIDFSLTGGWANDRGFFLGGGANLSVNIPSALSIGNVIKISGIQLAIVAGGDIEVRASADVAVTIGPVTATVQGLGLSETLNFPANGGNLGPMDLQLGFRAPDGIGIAIDSGPVSGGGALTFDPNNNRYFGAIELSIYSVSVKAFGIIETKLPTGPGYSFLIIISAEFTPIQLGFGFTLNGVGGLIGINRSVDSAGLLTMIKTGQLDNVLFPDDVVDNAPAILNDVETLFPPTAGHYVFGPLAKIGWGTPTLVDGELGLIFEQPGPVLTVIGTVHAALPTKDEAVVELNLDVGGVLDFPNKKFSLDASLHDSYVGDFPITGDMAMRMNWGQNPNFALSLGGFNPHYNPPAGFPKLKPVSVDLGSNGNPSIVLSGYMALTSNTAQLGAKVQANISKDGASISGFLSFDALFIFSPFSFEADIEGGVSASIDGYGISLDFHGTLSGPSPWHLAGKVCISLWFFSACADFSTTLGGTSQPTLPGVDPWTGSLPLNADGTQTVPGLQPTLTLSGNWGGNPPPGSFQAVTLVAPPQGTSVQTPIDPLGSATFRQKAVPLDLQITAFAGTAPSPQRNLHVSLVVVGPQMVSNPTTVNDYFAPGQYQKMKDADKLSSQSFVQLPAGFTVSSAALTFGPQAQVGLIYTDVTFAAPVGSPPTTTPDAYGPSQTHVNTVTGRSAATKSGLRNSALAAFVDPKAAPLVNLANELYTIANIGNLAGATGFQTNLPRPVATTALAAAAATSATARQTLQVAPTFFVQPSTFVL